MILTVVLPLLALLSWAALDSAQWLEDLERIEMTTNRGVASPEIYDDWIKCTLRGIQLAESIGTGFPEYKSQTDLYIATLRECNTAFLGVTDKSRPINKGDDKSDPSYDAYKKADDVNTCITGLLAIVRKLELSGQLVVTVSLVDVVAPVHHFRDAELTFLLQGYPDSNRTATITWNDKGDSESPSVGEPLVSWHKDAGAEALTLIVTGNLHGGDGAGMSTRPLYRLLSREQGDLEIQNEKGDLGGIKLHYHIEKADTGAVDHRQSATAADRSSVNPSNPATPETREASDGDRIQDPLSAGLAEAARSPFWKTWAGLAVACLLALGVVYLVAWIRKRAEIDAVGKGSRQ